ncbi:YehS family protein [Desulfocicer niacini]
MDNNDVLRRFRYALDVKDGTMVKIFELGNCNVDLAGINALLKKEDEPGYRICKDDVLTLFLEGLIIYNRGPRDGAAPSLSPKAQLLNNNLILKKLKIALELQQEDLMDIFSLAGVKVSKGELTALFRKEGHKNYRPCQDQFLRNFLKGLGIRHRK